MTGNFSDAEVENAQTTTSLGSWVFDFQTVEQRAGRLRELDARWGLAAG